MSLRARILRLEQVFPVALLTGHDLFARYSALEPAARVSFLAALSNGQLDAFLGFARGIDLRTHQGPQMFVVTVALDDARVEQLTRKLRAHDAQFTPAMERAARARRLNLLSTPAR